LGSIEGCFELGGWDVAAVAVEAMPVEPVHPRQRLELELVDVVSAQEKARSALIETRG
jgi:hypothetical protein